MNKNKNKWSYRYVAEFIGGGYLNHLVIVTDLGKDYADECYVNSLDKYCEDTNKKWFSFYFTGKTKESVGK